MTSIKLILISVCVLLGVFICNFMNQDLYKNILDDFSDWLQWIEHDSNAQGLEHEIEYSKLIIKRARKELQNDSH